MSPSHKSRILTTNGQRAPYVALSHCWGTGFQLEPWTPLTNKTIKLFEKELPHEPLPLNFQHAMTIAKRLGFRYLWIDCLCIVQDSKEDWAREAKRMGTVYRNATLTIFAAASEHSRSGILRTNTHIPDLGTRHLRVFPGRGKGRRAEEVHIGTSMSRLHNLRMLESEAPLNTRGWALQETILSRRHLIVSAESCTPSSQDPNNFLVMGHRLTLALLCR